ncbi:MAG: hypothetical protein EBS81_06835 [Gammaproteobacteria bacterium]|nr:hypothetical protein [Gammaproteobacteria bacterium]
MIMNFRILICLALTLAWTASVSGHHSTVGQIEEFSIEIEGVVKEFQFKNPHSWIQVMVLNADGTETEWSVEWLIPNILMRQGYNPSTFRPGDEVRVKLRQHVSGSPMGEFDGATKEDGTIVGRWE